MSKSVLIIGGSGFIGTHLALALRERHKVFATYSRHRVAIPGVTCVPLNLENRHWIKQVLSFASANTVIYAPSCRIIRQGYSGLLSGREGMDSLALERIHVEAAVNVLTLAEMMQSRFIYLSTCYAFDGSRGNYHEGDITLPANSFGKVKMAAENFIRSRSFHSFIIRSAPLFGRGNGATPSLLDYLRLRLDRGRNVEVNNDEIHAFAPVQGLVGLINQLIEQPPLKSRLLHYGGLTKLSVGDFARAFARRFGYDPALVITRSTESKGEKLDFSLNSSHAAELLKIKPFLLEEGFDLIEKELIARP